MWRNPFKNTALENTMKLWLPVWQETLLYLLNNMHSDNCYLESMYKKLFTKGGTKKGVSPQFLRKCLKSLIKEGLVKRLDTETVKKPYKLTEAGIETAKGFCFLKQIINNGDDDVSTIQ